MSNIRERLLELRVLMREHGLDVYIVPSADEHQNEYLPLRRARREFLSGFTGSAGDLLVGCEEAWLFADGRYHLQAEKQLRGTGITLVKLGTPGARQLPHQVVALARRQEGLKVGVDPMLVSVRFGRSLAKELKHARGSLVDVPGNLVDRIWRNVPSPSKSKLLALSPEWTGRTPSEKVEELRQDLTEAGAESTVVTKLDQIAWLLNLRSADDIPYNPVFESFLIVNQKEVHLFLIGGEERLPKTWQERPKDLLVHEYDTFAKVLQSTRGAVLVDSTALGRSVVGALEQAGCSLVSALSPIEKRKALKNSAERKAQRRANLRASVAKTRALLWLRRELSAGRTVTETGFKDRIESHYAEQEGYFGLSFTTISATGPNGAIVHYGECGERPLEAGDLFLIDSGAHIDGGTTDDTRTVSVGPCEDPEKRRIYSLVLKGLIACSRQRIPQGSAGTALDSLARSSLWNAGLNYDHGTGHGVGAFLNVHEGPFAISERERRAGSTYGLQAHMITSIEPGYYRPGWGGIRLENLYLLEAASEPTNSQKWLRLDPLTFVPFDRSLIDDHLLDASEQEWLRAYHATCLEKLSPLLSEEDRLALADLIG